MCLAVSIIQMLVLGIYLKEFLGYEYKIYWLPLCWICVEIVSDLVNYVGVPFYVNSIVYFLLLLFTTVILCKGSWKKKVLFILVYHGIVTIVEALLISVVMLIGNCTVEMISESEFAANLILILTQILVLIIIQVVNIVWKIKIGNRIKTQNWLGTILVSLSCFIAVVVLVADMIESGNAIISQIILLMLLIGMEFFNYYFYSVSTELEQAEITAEIYHNQVIMYKEWYKGNQRLSQEIHAFQHDINNHFGALRNICEKGEKGYEPQECLAKIGEYLDNIGKRKHKTHNITNSGNLVLDSVIDMKKSYCIRKNICVEEELYIPKNIDYDSTDLVILLGNLMDNAIEACDKLPTTQERRIIPKIQYRAGNLILSIQNTYDGSMDGQGGIIQNKIPWTTSKADSHMHGIGLYNVLKVVKKYDGTMRWKAANKLFTIDIWLYAPHRSEKDDLLQY
jgi:sensor histidine kinase YesM